MRTATETPEAVTPDGRGFRPFWGYSALTNLQDGVLSAAGPLVVASLDRSPQAVASAVVAQQTPVFLFSLLAGALADRVSRRTMALAGNAVRIGGLGLLALAAAGGWISVPLVLGVLFALGTAECFVDASARSILPSIVPMAELGTANARLFGVSMTMQRMVGPVVGAWLVVLGLAVPYAGSALMLAAALVLFARIPLPPHEGVERHHGNPLRQVAADVAEGARYLWSNIPVRELAILVAVMNVSFGALAALLVFVGTERTGLGTGGYGALLTAMGVGGLLGMWVYPRVETRASASTLLRIGLVFEVATHLLLAVLSTGRVVPGGPVVVPSELFHHSAWVLVPWFVLFGIHEAVWGTISTTIRQRTVPSRLLGRVMASYSLAIIGGAVLGSALGGALGGWLGWERVFWATGALAAASLLWVWRRLPSIAHVEPVPA
ncbi:MFS transporter [Falsarthrobacter nasiphocae]|uniref:MFS family permease n=1 Tax=Falsarthrobacter nasiphocae TaxID=189863 RepID=A0AAE3YGL9_9MICC|nr:MFS transporter [Falsarthrobacter nasiphocae]MDR6891882.1 MFS family permease [Falsarthrobacter nasiphocae]